jgi:hypothetical protein
MEVILDQETAREKKHPPGKHRSATDADMPRKPLANNVLPTAIVRRKTSDKAAWSRASAPGLFVLEYRNRKIEIVLEDPEAVSLRMRCARSRVHLLLVNRLRRLHFGANRLGPASAGSFHSATGFHKRQTG